MNNLTESPLFGLLLTIGIYELSSLMYKKWRYPLLNPLLLSTLGIIGVLVGGKIPFSHYMEGGSLISLLLPVSTVVLAVGVYSKWNLIKENLWVILSGCFVGSLVSVTSIYFFSKLFGLEEKILHSLLPKSVTTPIAIDLSTQLGGIVDITIAAVVVTGLIGAIFSPLLVKLFSIKGEVAQGLSIGTSTHVLGTSKAVEMGETTSAFSSVAIGISGLCTVVITLIYLVIFFPSP